jgi:predicted metal-dependent hydrolase
VSSSRPSKLTLLHELAHLMGSMGHGPHFQDLYEGLVRRHLSLQHALQFKCAIEELGE